MSPRSLGLVLFIASMMPGGAVAQDSDAPRPPSLGEPPSPDSESAADSSSEPASPSPSEEEPAPEEELTPEEMSARIRELEERLRVLEEARLDGSPLTINGYIDFGFFVPNGNAGVGWIRDVDNRQFPEFSNYAWTFLGDILATTINTRGEAANLGEGPGVERFDSVNSLGAPGFLVNELNLRVEYALSKRATARSSVSFVPRSGEQDFSIGDFVDIDLAELEYVVDDGNTSVFAGKMLPVFGIEYKERRSDQRFGITPSLVHRYTAGSQLGLKVRSKLLKKWLIVAASVTNNSSTTEQFHFYREIDSNSGKTLNGRLAVSVPVGDYLLALSGDVVEIGLSGEWGTQDRARTNDGKVWFVGIDATYASAAFMVKAQWMAGEAPGGEATQDRVWGLDLRHAAYLEVNWFVLPYLGALGRAELRDASVTLGNERLYLTKSLRFTIGAKATLNPHVSIKGEYLHNREYGGIAQFPNDILVTSLVLAY